MDEAQFDAESDEANRGFFRSLIDSWTSAGGSLKWGAGGVGLRGIIDGKEVGVCFLAPKFAGKQDRIELACTALAKQIGPTRMKEFEAALRSAAGELVLGKTMISVVQPGTLPAAKRKELSKAFVDLL
jgi:hypothetical protein